MAGETAIPEGIDAACHLNVIVADLASPRLGEALDALAALGYRRVVLPPVDVASVDAPALRETFASRGLTAIPIAGQSPQADVSSVDPWAREAGAKALVEAIGFAEALGSDQLNGVPYGPFERAAHEVPRDAWRRSAAAVGAAAEEAHSRGITMTFEVLNRYETAMVNTAEQGMAFAEESGSEHLRIHLDTFHMAIEEADTAAAIRAALPRLAYLELGQSGRGSLASGSVDVPGVVRGALADGYTGRWGVEAFSGAILPRPACEALAVWRDTYADGIALAEEAAGLIRAGAS
ncbi:MAG: sugar phosphate isomerase/epimerase family protein [Microbacterium sp.]